MNDTQKQNMEAFLQLAKAAQEKFKLNDIKQEDVELIISEISKESEGK